MSTHIDGLNTSITTVSLTTDDELADRYPDYEDEGSTPVIALEAPGNCHLVVIEGDPAFFVTQLRNAVDEHNPVIQEVSDVVRAEITRYEENTENRHNTIDVALDIVQRLHDVYGVTPTVHNKD